MSFFKKAEKVNTIFTIFGNAGVFWTWIGGGSMITALCGYFALFSNTLITVFGKPLAIMIGCLVALCIIAALLTIILKFKHFSNKKSITSDIDNEEKIYQNVADALKKGLYSNDLASKLFDKDIENMADGKLDDKRQTFTYNKQHFEEYCYQFLFNGIFAPYIKKGEEQKLNIRFLPNIAKAAVIYFEVEDDCKKYCKIYLFTHDKPILVENISLPQFVEFDANYKCVKFIVDFEDNSFDCKKAFINIRIKSFSI